MKRPGWLGGKDDSEAEADEDERPDGREPKPQPKAESAAERSARRTAAREDRGETKDPNAARRKLADRVGKAGDETKPKPKPRGPKRPERPERPKERHEPEARASKDSKDSKKPEKAKADEPAKKLNRPRRQPGSGATADGRRREKRGRDRDQGDGDREDEGRRRRERVKGEGGRKREGGGRKRERDDRPSAGKRARAGAVGFAAALKRGGVETRKWAAANGPKAGRMLLAALGAVFALFFEVLGFLLNLAFAAWRVVARPVRAVLGVLDRGARAASRRLTPARALTVVVAGAAILLALSQYADYRSISIGNGAYADVQSLAPAPETGRQQAGDPHSYAFVPVAIACLLLLAVATIGGRWRACRLIALAGFAAIVVALLVDRPAGLDPGDAALAFEGVEAKLIGGFYAQIAAGVLLIGSSSLLARELRLAAATEPAPAPRAERGEAKEPRSRRRTTARGTGPGTEGTARA